MKILMVNKFLYPNGGSETYVMQLGAYYSECGHEVQYFGMEHEGNCIGNAVNQYTKEMDFHSGGLFRSLGYAVKTIYSMEARRKIRKVLDDFEPDVVHLNNFSYQLTPSVILEIEAWKKKTKRKCRLIFTAHDYNVICPNHLLFNPGSQHVCEKCLHGSFFSCAVGKCIHGSRLKSVIGTLEAIYWNYRKVYRSIDTVICPSEFMKRKMDANPIFRSRTVVLHNFVWAAEKRPTQKRDYVLYFGRYTKEKGMETLLNVCRRLPKIPFVFAGAGPYVSEIESVPNIQNAGFLQGEELKKLISGARFSVFPSEWNENCPFSVMESQLCGTPVLASDIGGVSELLRDGITGELFRPGAEEDLYQRLINLWNNPDKIQRYTDHCLNEQFLSVGQYADQLLNYYQ